MRKVLLIFAALATTLPGDAAVRGVRVVTGFYRVAPAFGPSGYWYNPFYFGPYMAFRPNLGEVKLDTSVKDAEVFLDGGFAGTAGKLKSMWLPPGAHNLEVRSPGRTRYAERIYVLSGKTLHVHPDLRVETRQ